MTNSFKASVQPKSLVIFSLLFILFTIIGTLSHELGHVAAGKYLGFETELHYSSVTHGGSLLDEPLRGIAQENKEAIKSGQDFPDKALYTQYLDQRAHELFLFYAGGPLQTCLTGLIGLLLIFIRKPHIKGRFTKLDWLAIFLALFWLRQVFNVLATVASGLAAGSTQYFGGDEYNMAAFKGLPHGTFAISLGVIGALVVIYVTFKVVPKYQRGSFILGGFIGSAIGFTGWMYVLGPLLLP